MASRSGFSMASFFGIFVVIISLLSFTPPTIAANETYIAANGPGGEVIYLAENRRPALYTQDFGDCLGNSLLNVTRFDAAYYQDNMTVTFHLQGSTALNNESLLSTSQISNRYSLWLILLVYIGVWAYGESRFNLLFNPCNANIFR